MGRGCPLVIPGADVEYGMANGDEVREDCTNIELVLHLLINCIEVDAQPLVAQLLHAYPVDLPCIPFLSKRERPKVNPESLSLDNNKRPKRGDTNCNIANGSEDSTTTNQDRSSRMMLTITNFPSVETLLLETLGAKDNLPSNTPTFNSAELKRSVPLSRYLEDETMNLSVDNERMEIEVMKVYY